MTTTQQELIKCLQAYLKGEKLNKIEADKDLINLALEQSLQTVLYPVYNEKTYKKYYIGWVVKQEEFISIQKEITDIFNDNNLNHLYFKGSVLCNLYDDPSIRTRGDIDVYVGYNNLDNAKKLLLAKGFELDFGDNLHHINFKKNNISVELHFTLFDEEVSKHWNQYFNNPFEYSLPVSENEYKLDDTNHFIYCLCHFAKHLRQGAGMRYILDFYYMLEKTNINFELLHTVLTELDLIKLYKNTLNVFYYLIDKKYDDYDTEDCDFFIQYMLESGIHGKSGLDKSGVGVVKGNRFKFIMSRIFLSNKQYRRAIHPKLGSHGYLYPICLIVHWCHLLTSGAGHKIKTMFRIIFRKDKNKELYKKLGI